MQNVGISYWNLEMNILTLDIFPNFRSHRVSLDDVMLHYLIGTDMFHTLLLQDILANLFEALIDSSIILYLKSTIYRVSYA